MNCITNVCVDEVEVHQNQKRVESVDDDDDDDVHSEQVNPNWLSNKDDSL